MPTPRRYTNQAERQAAYRKRQAQAHSHPYGREVPALPPIATLPGTARWAARSRQAAVLLQVAQEEMEADHDQRSEAWQASERGETFRERLEAVQEVQAAAEALQA